MQLFYCRLFDQTATDGEKKALEEAEERIRQIEDEHRTRWADSSVFLFTVVAVIVPSEGN